MAVSVLAQTTSGSAQLSVTADVYAWPKDMQLQLTSATHLNDTIHQEFVSNYTLTYGSISTIAVPFEIVVHYAAPSPDNSQEHLVDYVLNSATTAYAGAPAVIDQQNRTITWSIPTLPAHTPNQTVTFQLKTNSRYMKTDTDVPIIVTARITKPFNLPALTHQTKYFFQPHLVPPTPTPTPTPAPQTIADVRVYPSASIKELVINQLNAHSITIKVQSNKNTTLKLLTGTNPAQLKKAQYSLSQSGNHLFKLTNLRPDTSYFMRFILQSGKNEYQQQDLFVFHTPTLAEEVELKKTYAVNLKNSQGTVFNGQLFTAAHAPPVILLPRQSTLSFDFTLDGAVPLSSVGLLLYQPELNSPDVAARSSISFSTPASSTTTPLPPLSNTLLLPNQLGEFLLVSRLKTAQGTIAESPLATVKTIKPIMIRHQKTGLPISNAKIEVYRYAESDQNLVPYPDPAGKPLLLYSQDDGSVPFIPQEGKFRFIVTRAPYYPKQVDLTIRLSQTMVLPDIELKPTAISWLEPLVRIWAYFNQDPTQQLQALQHWLDEWSEALVGYQAFPPENTHLETTDSF